MRWRWWIGSVIGVATAGSVIAVGCGSAYSTTPTEDAGDGGSAASDAETGPMEAAVDGGGSDAAPGNDGGCPGGRGPAMVRTDRGCVDVTEVTQASYAAFLASSPGAQPAECSWNTSYVPGQQMNGFVCSANLFDPSGHPDHPVRCVDWCDAVMFCAWAGKRLCGGVGGQRLGLVGFADPAQSVWMNACSRGGTLTYPYGPVYTPDACQGAHDAGTDPSAVASAPSCVGGFPGLFDMSGNVEEWEDACDRDGGGNASCRLRGGGVYGTAADLACASDHSTGRQGMGAAIGFRCCAP